MNGIRRRFVFDIETGKHVPFNNVRMYNSCLSSSVTEKPEGIRCLKILHPTPINIFGSIYQYSFSMVGSVDFLGGVRVCADSFRNNSPLCASSSDKKESKSNFIIQNELDFRSLLKV
jgi:hypothetical protein